MELEDKVRELSRPLTREIIDNLPGAVVVTDHSGRILYHNEQFQRLVPPTGDNPINKNIFIDYPFEASDQKIKLLEEAIQTGEDKFSTWVGYDRRNDNERYFNIKISPFKDKSGTQMGLEDVTREVHAATIDALTGCYSQSYYYRALRSIATSQALRTENGYLGVIGVDVKGLKRVNNTISHAAGSILLQETGRLLRESVEDLGYVVRDGGDEFIILCPGANQEILDAVIQRIDAKINGYNGEIQDQALRIQIYRVGVAGQKGAYNQAFGTVDEQINLQKSPIN